MAGDEKKCYFSLEFRELYLSLPQKNSFTELITKSTTSMRTDSFLHRAFHLYYDGFRSMTLGRTLWLIIGIKLFIMFAILKVFFFPNFLRQNAEKGGEADFVAAELVERGVNK